MPLHVPLQVRVYEFSESASCRPVIHFETVGGAAANEVTIIEQPAGFQLRAQLLVHSADVTALSLYPAFKSLAVADRSGIVSLLDLSKPALMWLQVWASAGGWLARAFAAAGAGCTRTTPPEASTQPAPLTASRHAPQAPMRVLITSLSLARCPLPPPRDRHELLGACATLPAGAPVKCVLAAGADGAVAIMDHATGFCIAR